MKFFKKILYYLKKARGMPLSIILTKLKEKFLDIFFGLMMQRMMDFFIPSYSQIDNDEVNIIFNDSINLKCLESYKKTLFDVSDLYSQHYFDVLGSGWKKNKSSNFYSSYPNSRIQKTLKKNITANYDSINWNKDFKSNYSWNLDWYKFIEYGNIEGVDVKVPWEISRMHHLPQLAITYHLSKKEGFSKENLLDEIINQIYDFSSQNPPRFGVNWSCTMDVSIRVVNVIVAYNILVRSGANFPNKFKVFLFNFIKDHGDHIIKNLEWSQGVRGNHYLSNLCGLIFSFSSINTNNSDEYLCFSINELLEEIDLQFNKDGSNFEGSTTYHCLSSEIIGFSLAILSGMSDEMLTRLSSYQENNLKYFPFKKVRPITIDPESQKIKIPNKTSSILKKIPEFIEHCKINNETFLQIGDNDSGRLLKIAQKYKICSTSKLRSDFQNLKELDLTNKEYILEIHMNYDSVMDLFNTLLGDNSNDNKHDNFTEEVVKSLSSSNVIESLERKFPSSKQYKVSSFLRSQQKKYTFNSKKEFKNIFFKKYTDFGLCFWRTSNLYLSLRCGPYGQNGYGGHSHNDQLSMELWIDGRPIFRDPGAYLYTPDLFLRNKYRSARAHFLPHVNVPHEPSSLEEGTFLLREVGSSNILDCKDNYFLGVNNSYGFDIYREVIINSNSIDVNDFHSGSENIKFIDVYEKLPFSPAYGWRENER